MDCIKKWQKAISIGCLGLVGVTGCSPVQRFKAWKSQADVSYFQNYATQIEYPDVSACVEPAIVEQQRPLTIENPSEIPTWELSLSEAITYALHNSAVLRSLGGSVVDAPAGSQTTFNPALTESNPNAGVDAALSAFDSQLSTQLFWSKTDIPNNLAGGIFGVFTPSASQGTRADFSQSIQKRAATGTQFTLSHTMVYDNNNRPGRAFQTDFVGVLQAEMRQPLLRGAGTTFNRIAGPGGIVGSYNGVLIARIRTDISLADFESGVIRMLSEVESAYWELYYAYRDLETQVAARTSALQTWQRVNELQKVGSRGGEADAEAQARSQYYRFESQVNNSLSGANGLYGREQSLRYLIGMPPSDGRLIKPIDEPLQAEVVVDWDRAVSDALFHRVEVRRQKWTIKQRELELVAARLNRRPQLDAVTSYSWRGLGDHLINSRDPANDFRSVYQSLLTGDYQEWRAGLEFSTPVGMRQASAAVRNAQLNLARDVAVLKEQELRITHDIATALRRLEQSYDLVEINLNRVEADRLQVEVLRNRYERGLININILLDAQQFLATSQAAFYRSLVDYELSVRDFHQTKGSLLAYNQVGLSEANWPSSAYADAAERGKEFTPRENSASVPRPISQGAFNPETIGAQ